MKNTPMKTNSGTKAPMTNSMSMPKMKSNALVKKTNVQKQVANRIMKGMNVPGMKKTK